MLADIDLRPFISTRYCTRTACAATSLEVAMARWRLPFMAEVKQSLEQFGVRTCSVCGSEGLSMRRHPVLLVDGEFPAKMSDVPMKADPFRRITFAVKIECRTCGYIMLFNAERHRTGDDPITFVPGIDEDGGPLED